MTLVELNAYCRCGKKFCSEHRYAELHNCCFDYKKQGRLELLRNNPIVRAEKLEKIWSITNLKHNCLTESSVAVIVFIQRTHFARVRLGIILLFISPRASSDQLNEINSMDGSNVNFCYERNINIRGSTETLCDNVCIEADFFSIGILNRPATCVAIFILNESTAFIFILNKCIEYEQDHKRIVWGKGGVLLWIVTRPNKWGVDKRWDGSFVDVNSFFIAWCMVVQRFVWQ